MNTTLANNIVVVLVVVGFILFLFEYPQAAIVLAGMAVLLLLTQ